MASTQMAQAPTTNDKVLAFVDEVREMLTGLNADHCLPADTHFDKRIDALREAVDRWLHERDSKKAEKPADSVIGDPLPQPSQ